MNPPPSLIAALQRRRASMREEAAREYDIVACLLGDDLGGWRDQPEIKAFLRSLWRRHALSLPVNWHAEFSRACRRFVEQNPWIFQEDSRGVSAPNLDVTPLASLLVDQRRRALHAGTRRVQG